MLFRSVFGYRGEIPSSATEPVLDFDRVAVFANVYAPRAKGVLGLLWGSDRPAGESSLLSKGGFLLGEFLLADRWAGYGRYDYARRGLPAGDAETTDGPTLGVSFWAQTQVRLTLEAQFLKTADLSQKNERSVEVNSWPQFRGPMRDGWPPPKTSTPIGPSNRRR